jgi:hypothetical protein
MLTEPKPVRLPNIIAVLLVIFAAIPVITAGETTFGLSVGVGVGESGGTIRGKGGIGAWCSAIACTIIVGTMLNAIRAARRDITILYNQGRREKNPRLFIHFSHGLLKNGT